MGKTFEEGENFNWMAPMVEYAMEHGAVYHYNTTAKQLIRDDDGRVSAWSLKMRTVSTSRSWPGKASYSRPAIS